MTDRRANTLASDWRIGVSTIARGAAFLSLGAQKWSFYSPRTGYACVFIAARGGVGLTVGVGADSSLLEFLTDLVNDGLSATTNIDRDDVRILRPFSATELTGASSSGLSFGATAFVFNADGETLTLKNNAGRSVAELKLGSIGAALGVSVNMGTLSVSTLYGPFDARAPVRILKTVHG